MVATGRNLDKGENALRDVAGESLAGVALDVSSEAEAQPAVDEAVKRFGLINVAVNNAGYGLLGNFETSSAGSRSARRPTLRRWC
ncbi:MAG: SDR family NAD(P)-dependent oxidoreductase [Microvirga sp.]